MWSQNDNVISRNNIQNCWNNIKNWLAIKKNKNEELTNNPGSVAENASKILQEAFKTMSSKLVELETQH